MLKSLLKMLNRVFEMGVAVQRPPLPASPEQPLRKLKSTIQTAATSLSDMPLVNSDLHKRQSLKTSWEGSHPLIVEFYRKFHKELNARGYPFYAHRFVRPSVEQRELIRKGRSKAVPGTSPHNWGMAVDIVHSAYHWDIHPKEWELIGAIGKEVARRANIPIEWGGDWSFHDPAHWQLKDWRDIRDGRKPIKPSRYSARVQADFQRYKLPHHPF